MARPRRFRSQLEATGDLPQGSEPVELDPADFTTEIDNPYFPVTPGTSLDLSRDR